MSIARGLCGVVIFLLLDGRCQRKAVAIGTADLTASARLATAMPEQDRDADKVNNHNPFREFRDDDLRIVNRAQIPPLCGETRDYSRPSADSSHCHRIGWHACTEQLPRANCPCAATRRRPVRSAKGRASIQAILHHLDHLNDYKQHYTARYLEWTERTTGRAGFARFATAMPLGVFLLNSVINLRTCLSDTTFAPR